MDAANQRLTQLTAQLQRFVNPVWYTLRSPKTTGILLVILAIVLLLGLIIPRQPELITARTVWITTLPPWLQPGGNFLYSLGFANIFQTLWFWLPVALLLLNSLIALADYAPGSWQRLSKTMPPLDWQHPLARRVEYSVRLPRFFDDFLETLRERLQEERFSLYQSSESEQRDTGAGQRRWAWLGVVACYAGLIVLIGAFLMTYYSLETDRFTLLPFQPQSSFLFEGAFELTEAESARVSHVAYMLPGTEQYPQMLIWRLYQPTFLNNKLIFPLATNPVLTIEVRDATGTLLELGPLQENPSLTKRLSLPLDKSNSPLHFVIPAEDLTVQVSPDPTTGENSYNVQVLLGSEVLLLENIEAQTGQVFEVDGFSAVIFLNHSVSVMVRCDAGLPLYLVSAVLILTGLFLTFLQPPALVWLVPEVKGIGGQLYGVMEKFGSEKKTAQFLEELLTVAGLSEEQGED